MNRALTLEVAAGANHFLRFYLQLKKLQIASKVPRSKEPGPRSAAGAAPAAFDGRATATATGMADQPGEIALDNPRPP